MFTYKFQINEDLDKKELYKHFLKAVNEILSSQDHILSVLSNITALTTSTTVIGLTSSSLLIMSGIIPTPSSGKN
mgnify:CR=1 FL=1